VSTRRIPSETTTYAWDTSSDLPELATETVSKGKKSQTSSYTYGAGPIGLVNEAGSYAFHTDSLGSVMELSDASGNSVESYRYSSYGEAYAPGESSEASSRSSNPIRFTGQYFDSESDLYNMRAREYEPETGRFLETDPLQCDSGGSCGSTYVYVDDQPTVMTDPTGERGRMMTMSLTTGNPAEQAYCASGAVEGGILGGPVGVLLGGARSYLECKEAFKISRKAIKRTEELLNKGIWGNPAGFNDGPADAFRHCYWSGTMTIAFATRKWMFDDWSGGAVKAKIYGDLHEYGVKPPTHKNPKLPHTTLKQLRKHFFKRRAMDLHNNAAGIGYARDCRNNSELEKRCINGSRPGGDLVVLCRGAECRKAIYNTEIRYDY
jgi:RHS repeat-associated protein